MTLKYLQCTNLKVISNGHEKDKIFYNLDDVLKIIDLPIPTENRGQFKLKEDFKL